MARICPYCNKVHPQGVVLCSFQREILRQDEKKLEEVLREMEAKERDELRKKAEHYQQHHPHASWLEAVLAVSPKDEHIRCSAVT